MARFEVPVGWSVQAFRFTLDPTEEQARSLARHFGARRKAFNWAVAALKGDIAIERLIRSGRARVLAISLRRGGTRLDASVRVLVQRPQQPNVALPDSRVGVDVGVRRLATIADEYGAVIEQLANPRPLDAALRELRHVSRARSRCTQGSRRYRERTTQMSRLHRRVNDVRTHHLHVLTTRLAQTHGRIVVEGLDAGRDAAAKGPAGGPRPAARALGCGPGHTSAPPVL